MGVPLLATGAEAGTGAVLFAVAVLLVAAKLGGLLTERLGQPGVLGELLVGILLGNTAVAFLGGRQASLLRDDPTVSVLAEIGVLLLLFDVGLESDLRALARVGPSAALVAMIGVAVPFALGWAVSAWFLPDQPRLVHVFLAASLTATSVGITARVLKDLDASRSPEGQVILGAALVDDVLGLVVLAVVTGGVAAGRGDGGTLSWVALAAIVAKAAVFLGAAILAGHVLSGPIVRALGRTGHHGLVLVVGVALCFALAFVAERIGLAGIIGAFAAGLVLDPYGVGVRTKADAETLNELLSPLATVFVPLYFVLMGLQVDLGSLGEPGAIMLGVGLVVVAIVGKLACAAGVVRAGVNRLAVGIGMVPRGEVGLIFAGVGAALAVDGKPLLAPAVFSALVMMVVVTTVITPPALRAVFAGRAQRRRSTS